MLDLTGLVRPEGGQPGTHEHCWAGIHLLAYRMVPHTHVCPVCIAEPRVWTMSDSRVVCRGSHSV